MNKPVRHSAEKGAVPHRLYVILFPDPNRVIWLGLLPPDQPAVGGQGAG